jgi:hypothetical protein
MPRKQAWEKNIEAIAPQAEGRWANRPGRGRRGAGHWTSVSSPLRIEQPIRLPKCGHGQR